MIVLSKPADWIAWYGKLLSPTQKKSITSSLKEGKVVVILSNLAHSDQDLKELAQFLKERSHFGDSELKDGFERLRSITELLGDGCEEASYSGWILGEYWGGRLEVVDSSTFVLTFAKRCFLPPKSVKKPRNIQELAETIPADEWYRVLRQLVSRVFDERLLSVKVWDKAAVDDDISLSEQERKVLLQEIKKGSGFALRVKVMERVVYEKSWQQGGTH